jgi:uncharacterized phiE125 gp8 family phage protein
MIKRDNYLTRDMFAPAKTKGRAMRTTLTVTTEPAGEPTTVELVKQHCRIDSNADDELLAGYLATARIMAEDYLSRALLTQTILWTVRPASMLRTEQTRLRGMLQLPRAPVQSIEAVTILDEWGNLTTIPVAVLPITPSAQILGYVADLELEPATLLIGRETVLGGGYPVRDTRLQHIQVSMVAGYGAAQDVPVTIVQAIMMMTAFFYEHRGDSGGTMPEAAERLLDRQRLQFLGG